jgi:hypothetical protein
LAWGADGHRAVAAIAIKLLPPDKAQAANNLLSNSDVDRDFIDAASYADEVIRERDHRHVFSPWHFVDWPADAATYSDSFCDPDCIVNELPKQIEAMRTSTNTEAKALAMSWVIHLMGDLHQPIHVTDRGDRGGNDFKVTYNGRTRCRESNSTGTETKVELHSVWDSCLVFTLENGRTFDKLADDLRGNLTTYKGHPAASGTMMDWMKETHQAGIDTAYDGLSKGDDIAGVYIGHALPVVQQQTVERRHSPSKDHRRKLLGVDGATGRPLGDSLHDFVVSCRLCDLHANDLNRASAGRAFAAHMLATANAEGRFEGERKVLLVEGFFG